MTHRSRPLAGRSALFLAAAQAAAVAQGQPARAPADPDRAETQALKAEQFAKVRCMLAGYKADQLAVDDAKAIKRALRDAGLRPKRALGDAIPAAGFSPETLEPLEPRPPGPPPDGAHPARRPTAAAEVKARRPGPHRAPR